MLSSSFRSFVRSPALGLAAAMSLSVGAVSVLAPAPASACGGFFCNRGAPVEQTGEHILFVVDEEAGTTETHVLVNYAGPSEQFAWIVPTPSLPEIGISSPALFTALESVSAPRWLLRQTETGECTYDWTDSVDVSADVSAMDAGAGAPVFVVSERSVGAYDTVTLQATDSALLVSWLQDNGYDVPDDITPLLEPYVLMGGDVHFVAFKLQSDRSAGDIQPVRLTYDGVKPAIPIQLTAVATVPDLGVTAYVLGEYRAVPENYLSVEINEARLDWLSAGSNYETLINEAMNEAGGHGFRTEFAGPSNLFHGTLTTAWFDYEQVAAATASDVIAVLQSQGFVPEDTLPALRRHLPAPGGVDEVSFYNCVQCYLESGESTFDAVALADDLWANVVEPLEHAEELFERFPYVTRMYTTLSAEEMTLDPIFSFNPDMNDVDNVRYADAEFDCGDGLLRSEAPVTITLEDGRTIALAAGGSRQVLDAMPAADSMSEAGAEGEPKLVQSNREAIDAALARHNGGENGGSGGAGSGGSGGAGSGGSGGANNGNGTAQPMDERSGCSSASGGAQFMAPAWMLVLLGAVAAGRAGRRRRD